MRTSTRNISITRLGFGFSLLLLAACGGGGGSEPTAAPASAQPRNSSGQSASYTFSTSSVSYTVQLLGTLGEESYAVALNDRGQVVGNYLDRAGRVNAFVWENGTMRAIATPGQARQINNLGQIVGWTDPAGFAEAFVAAASGTAQRLNTLGGASQALTINDLGEIAGRITNGGEMAFVASAGRQQLIAHEVEGYATAMNASGQVLIRQLQSDGFRTLLWDNGRLVDLGDLGGKCTQGLDINASGQVVGWAQTATGDYHAFRWENGVMTDLSGLAGNFSSAVAINDHGEIVLKYSYDGGQGLLLLTATGLLELGNLGTNYAVANDMNNRGEIVGWLQTPDGSLQAFLASPNR